MATTTTTSLEQQISKLGHRLKDIRFRAMQSILLKLDSNLVSVDEVCSVGVSVVRHCKKWLSDSENASEFGSALRLLDTVCSAQNGECLEAMLDAHFPSFLQRLSTERALGQQEQQRAQHIISVLIHCPQFVERESSSQSPLLPPRHNVASGTGGSSQCGSGRMSVGGGSERRRRRHCWRFPAVALIRSDVEHLFDLSLRLKVQSASMCSWALLQFEQLTIWHFPPEIVLQRDLGLFDSMLSVLGRRPLSDHCHLVTQCLHSLTVWTQRMAHSLRLRADPSTMRHPAEAKVHDEWRYPNDFSPDHCGGAEAKRFIALHH